MNRTESFTKNASMIADSLLNTIREKYSPSDWVRAIYTDLHSSDGNASMLKLRILLASEKIDASKSPVAEIRDLVADTWEEMFQKSKDIWYGFKLTVFPDGTHEIEYNYDPNCIKDPTFIDF